MRRVMLEGGRRLTQADLNRSGVLPAEVMAAAEKIVDDVRERGDRALREYCKKFDGVDVKDFAVDPSVMDEALEQVGPAFRAALEKAAAEAASVDGTEVESQDTDSGSESGESGESSERGAAVPKPIGVQPSPVDEQPVEEE